ncbi:phage tail tube protein [Nocardia sp. NPDC055165]
MPNYIGRRELIGLGIEGTAGTAVAPQIWARWLDQKIEPKTKIVENESATGVVEKVNGSAVTAKWVEGPIGGTITAHGMGFFLLGMFGSVSTGSPTSGIYPHTFSVNQLALPTTLTISHVTPLESRRHPYAVLDNLEISAEAGGYVMFATQVKARYGSTSSESPAFTTEAEFTSKHITVKQAANIAGLGAATAIKASKVKVTLERASQKFDPLGTDNSAEFDRGEWEAKAEIVVRYDATTYDTDFLANTAKALGIYITDGTNSLNLVGGNVRIRELAKTVSRGEIVTQTLSLYYEVDASTGKTVEAILSNSRATYAAA